LLPALTMLSQQHLAVQSTLIRALPMQDSGNDRVDFMADAN
jgi:hypothetical protein